MTGWNFLSIIPFLIIEFYYFFCRYLVCKESKSKKCPGKATLKGENFMATTDHKYHGQRSTEEIKAEIAFRRSLNQACVTCFTSLRTIYDTLIIM